MLLSRKFPQLHPFYCFFFPKSARNIQKPFYFSFAWKSATHIGYPQWLINVNHHFPQAIQMLCSHRIRAVEPRRWERPRFSLAAPEGRGVCDGRKRRARCSSCWGWKALGRPMTRRCGSDSVERAGKSVGKHPRHSKTHWIPLMFIGMFIDVCWWLLYFIVILCNIGVLLGYTIYSRGIIQIIRVHSISRFFTGETGLWFWNMWWIFGTAAGRSSSNHCFSLCPKDPIAAVQTSDVATPDLWCHCRGVR